ncbi:hypothetical protein SLEP1_g15110 [Rubroshorea leprosula]|uniref:Uncharacterized protein n=1 Tax=Rubroshorea leprosula TaxID=152421 RepID=A0AAV5IWS5_9ROSI|nr:hypothetical protein SLEP1_g15110 [Rubroshorea leprosula]
MFQTSFKTFINHIYTTRSKIAIPSNWGAFNVLQINLSPRRHVADFISRVGYTFKGGYAELAITARTGYQALSALYFSVEVAAKYKASLRNVTSKD